MHILLHVCCGPCTIYPLRVLREQGHTIEGFFYNPNIHPYKEFQRRLEALRELADRENFSIELKDKYGLHQYLQRVVFHEPERCLICYDMRLEETAKNAALMGFEGFSTTLLYSRYQQHDIIRQKGEQLARAYGITFYYEDFRLGWQEGVDRSREMGLYRQPYCGCIYSEQERYDKSFRKQRDKGSNE